MMKKILLVAVTVTLLGFMSKPNNRIVYVCGKSKIFHDRNTHGALKRCTKYILAMQESQAIEKGKRECRCRDK